MKHIIYIITALLVCTVSIQAQRRDFPALQVTLLDGTKDTLFIGTNGVMSMYGLNDATCEDYLKIYPNTNFYFDYDFFDFDRRDPYWLTSYGKEADYEGYGIIVSDKQIDDNKSIGEIRVDSQGFDCSRGGCLYINEDEEKWVYYNTFSWCFDFCYGYYEVLSLKYGATYYWRTFYILDGKTYLGEEKSVRCPKLMSYILKREKIWQTMEAFAIFNNEGEVREELSQHYGGYWSEYLDSCIEQQFKEYRHTLTEEQVAAAAVRTEVCDDGTMYFIDMPESEIQKIIADIDAEGNTPFYVQANNETTVFMNTRTTKIVTCDEKWGVRDNQYITSDILTTAYSRPDIYVKLNHVMLPGKTYNITVTIAPQTDETKEIKPLYMRLDISRKDYDDKTFNSMVSVQTGFRRLNVPEAKLVDDIIADGETLSTITVQYTPEQFVYYNAFSVGHTKSFTSVNNRNRYEQHIRLVGIEVTPVEETTPAE